MLEEEAERVGRGGDSSSSEEMHDESSLPEDLSPDKMAAVKQYWTMYDKSVRQAVRHLRQTQANGAGSAGVANVSGELLGADDVFYALLDLPLDAPVQPEHYGVTMEELYRSERLRLTQKIEGSHRSKCAIVDATITPLEINRLCPYALAVLIQFISHCGVAPEFPLAFFYSICGWLLHSDLHATLSLDRPEWRVRPRVFAHINGDVGTGKTTFR